MKWDRAGNFIGGQAQRVFSWEETRTGTEGGGTSYIDHVVLSRPNRLHIGHYTYKGLHWTATAGDEVRSHFTPLTYNQLRPSLARVDFDPAAVRRWLRDDRNAIYGDAMDPAFVASLPLGVARWAIATMPAHDTGVFHEDPRIALINALKDRRFAGRIAVANRYDAETEALRRAGADIVLEPFTDAADQAIELLVGDAKPVRPAPSTGDEQAPIPEWQRSMHP